MSKSLRNCHIEVVEELKKRGEVIINPAAPRTFLGKDGRSEPSVFVKNRKFGTNAFISGSAFREKDGTITILHDMLQYQHGGFSIEQLGLCDPVCWYENFDEIRRREECKPKRRTCPQCGVEL